MNSSLLCHSCFKCSWRKDHWLFNVPRETIIKSTSDNASITSTSQAVVNVPQSLQPSSHSVSQECDKHVPNNSVSSFFDCYPDSPFCSSSDFSSSLPGYFSDTSSHGSSSLSPDYHCSCIYCASSSCVSSLCESSSPLYLPTSSDFNSYSSISPSPDSSPPNNSTKKVKIPYYMETPVVKVLLKDDKPKQKSRKEKDEQSQYKEERMDALSIPSPLSNQHILFKTQSVTPDSEPSTSPLLNVGEHQLQTLILTKFSPNFQKTTIAEKLTLQDELKPAGHGNLQKVPTSVSVSGNVRQEDSSSIPRCSLESIIGTNVQQFTAQAQSSSSLISSPSTHMSVSFQTTSSTNQGRAKPQKKVKWGATSNQNIDKWIQKPKTSMGSQGSHPF